jgi:hypothetical protein
MNEFNDVIILTAECEKELINTVEYLPRYIENHKNFCGYVNDLQTVDLKVFANRVRLRMILEQSKSLFTELNGERLRLEFELNHIEEGTPTNNFPSNKLINDVEYESFHNKQVIEMSRRIVSKHITLDDLAQINIYLYTVKQKIQQMADTNHKIANRIH